MSAQYPYPKARLLVEQSLAEGAVISLESKQAHYLLHVLRLREGDGVALFNGRDGEWIARLANPGKKTVEAVAMQRSRTQAASPDIWLCFAPIKHGKIDFLAQKATELGAARLCPVVTRRTVVSRVNLERLQANAIEAAEQSERLDVPQVMNPVTFPDLLANWEKERVLIYADETGGGALPQTLLPSLASPRLALLVGPEGGFAPEELKQLQNASFALALTLGPRILRADTAALAALTCLMAWCGDWDHKPTFRYGA